MLIDGVRFDDAADSSARRRAVGSFISFIERKLGITALYDRRRIPFGREDLLYPFSIATLLLERGVIEGYNSFSTSLPDEPPIKLWSCRIKDPEKNLSGGTSVDDDGPALLAALAESLERYIWFTQHDYFTSPVHATASAMRARAAILAPERFAALTQAQRELSPRLRLDPDAKYLWIRGTSLVTGKGTYVPAQQVSATHRPWERSPREPLIRSQITNGLATWPTQAGARLRGTLECLERDAYMIMWFNQLTLPRVKLSSLRARSSSLDALLTRCEKYRLYVHIVPMLTDAPAHAVCAIVEDKSEVGPRFMLGLKANRSLARAAEGALLEALRARRFTRPDDPAKHFDPSKPVEAIGHRGRTYYWRMPEHAKHLEFLIAGPEQEFAEAAWEHDSDEQQLDRIISWCREKKYELVSVPLTRSKANPTPWHIEMVLMPELQWTHLNENLRHLGGERLRSIPRRYGYTPRGEPFVERPHPFC